MYLCMTKKDLIMAHQLPLEALAVFPPPGMAFPHTFTFTVDQTTLLYLAATPDQPNQQLYALNLTTGERRIAAIPPNGGTQEDNLSPEEELRRQRARQLTTGITQYSRAQQSDRLLIPLLGSVYLQDRADAPLRITAAQDAITPTLSPDGSKIAYVYQGEVYVIDVDDPDAIPRAITNGSAHTTRGLAEYIAQEEMGRSEGFWWSPEGSRIAYAEVDESHLPIYQIPHSGKDQVTHEDHRYPFAGADNAKVSLKIAALDGSDPITLDISGYEYVARVFWWADGTPGAQLLNREQTQLDLVRFDPETGERTLIHREQSAYWVNLRRAHFKALADGRFVWGSERSGMNHLYLYAPDGHLIRALTTGDWMVDSIEAVDLESETVYFTGNRESPLDTHLYAVSFDGSHVRRITPENGTHHVKIDPTFQMFVDVYHSLSQPPMVTVRSLSDARVIHTLHTPNDPRLAQFQLTPPEIVEIDGADGLRFYGAVYRPSSDDGASYFPTIVHVYGGPGPQMVANSWALTCALQLQYLRQAGYLVFRLDNRGSARRGIAFEGALKFQMGSVEVEDQVMGVRWLIAQGLTDPTRIGITGWSYGGYMATLCLLKAPELFKVAVAGAPVTHWDGYDTCYTERYMGTPQSNPDGYAQSSVLTYVDRLRGKLLLIHGLLDENVHFRHTARLMNALNRARKHYDVLLFPDERHLPRRPDDRTYLQERIVGYFKDHL